MASSGSPDISGHTWTPRSGYFASYDPDGNLKSDGRWDYSWNAENRLTRMTTTTAAANAGVPRQQLEFVYDSQGRRVAKNVTTSTDGAIWTFASSMRFLYDGWNLIAEYSAPSTASTTLTLQASHTWGIDLSGTMQGAGGVGGLLCSSLNSQPSTLNFFPSYDGNGNISAWIDATGGLLERMDYSPFGKLVTCQKFGSSGVLSRLNFGFSTKFTDAESELLYYGYRYYDPITGRWPSRDPIGERGGMNLYGMVTNDSLNQLDFRGLMTYFSIYYVNREKDPDGSFKRAAETWKKNVESGSDFESNCDVVILKGVKTESDFVSAWAEIKSESEGRKPAYPDDYRIAEGVLYVHGGWGHLFFVPDTGSKSTDGELTPDEQKTLGGLPWDDAGFLSINACHSASGSPSTAENFADSQRVITRGEGGFAYFSQSDTEYIEVTSSSREVYLRAFKRHKNGTDNWPWNWERGYNDPINRKIYKPAPTAPRLTSSLPQ